MRTLKNVKPSPEQLPILQDDGPGFRLIRGAAGSGKTTSALLRLRQLCASRRSRRARHGLADPVRVLVLTFNRTLRGYVNQLADEQVADGDDLSLTVETFGRWAMSLAGGQTGPLDDGRPFIQRLLGDIEVRPKDMDYFVDEIEYIRGRFQPGDLGRYLGVTRFGRGRAPAVPRRLRQRLLEEVVTPYEAWKSKTGRLDWDDIAMMAANTPKQGYNIVIADETQDFSANQMRAILAHLHEEHVTTFIIDTTQRIYPRGFRWRELGIEMRPEMVFTLGRNHRNTVEVARLASSIVRGLPSDEDGLLPNPEQCQESGTRPKILVGRYRDQLRYMLDHVQPLLTRGDTVAILHARGGGWFDYTRNDLRRRNIDYCELTRSSEWPMGDELAALSTIHSAKGLEFDHVLMPGLSDDVTSHGGEDGDGTLDSLRRLTAMGVGRARKSVMLGYKPGERSTVFDLIDPATYDLVEL